MNDFYLKQELLLQNQIETQSATHRPAIPI